MKKIFEIPELEVVRFVEADIVVCSGCTQEWMCASYGVITGDQRCETYRECSPHCSFYTLNPDLDGTYDPTDDCPTWRSECENYEDSGMTSSCSKYFYTEPWTDEYGNSRGGWTFEENPAYGCYTYSIGRSIQLD